MAEAKGLGLSKEGELTYKIFTHLVMKVEIGALNAALLDNLMALSQAAAKKIQSIK